MTEMKRMHTTGEDLDFALMLASVGERIALGYFREPELDVQLKLDGSPVSSADRDVEHELTRLIERWRPGDAVLGEELGRREGSNDRRWIIDPIDGTANYVGGHPDWAVLVALEVAGQITVGVISAPILDTTWWAARGLGAHRNGETIHARRTRPDQPLVVSRRAAHVAGARAIPAGMRRLIDSAAVVDATPTFWPELLVAEGVVDIDVCPAAQIWDLAPRQIIVEETGGVFSDLAGRRRSDGGSSLTCSSAAIQREMLEHGGAIAGMAG